MKNDATPEMHRGSGPCDRSLMGTTSTATTSTANRQAGQIPRVTGGSVLGLGRDFATAPVETSSRLFREHGDILRFRVIANQYFYLISHPDLIRGVFGASGNFTKAPHPAFTLLSMVMGNGLVTSDGELWARQRRLAQPAFTKQRVAGYGEMMTTATVRMFERWARHDPGEPLLVDQEMTHLTLEIVGRALFSMDLAGDAAEVGRAFTDAGERMSQLLGNPSSVVTLRIPFLPSTRRFQASVEALDQIVQGIIDDRRASEPRNDLLSWLIEARDTASGEVMDDHQLRDEVKTQMLAGYDSTADALIWTLHLLSVHQAARARVEEEIDAVLDGGVATVADLPRLGYTKMVIQEAMRLYPPIYMFARWGHQPADIGGYRLPANAGVLVSPYVVHRHPDFWPEPERFDPDRFAPEEIAGRNNYAYIPFGIGPRQCVGNHFAMLEAMLVIATVMRNFRLDAVPGFTVTPGTFTTFRPRHGLPMLLSRRQGAFSAR